MNSKVALSLLSLFTVIEVQAFIFISEIDLSNNRVELVNTGANVDISDWWFCNRLNGTPNYDQVDDRASVIAGLSTAGTTFANFAGGSTLVLEFTSGNFTPNATGELGLYTTNSFGSSTAIEDYVSWGADGVRDTVANTAGLWVTSEFIDVSGLAAGETIQTTFGTNGLSVAEWTIGNSTLGTTNVPEPSSTALLIGFVSLGLIARRRR